MMVVDVVKVLDKLGVYIIRARGDEMLSHCPGHEARTGQKDVNPSWYINQRTGAHMCFSCGFKGNLFSLVGELQGLYISEDIDYGAVSKWIAQVEEITPQELAARLKEAPQYVAPKPELPMDNSRLALFTEPPAWALKARNLTAEACRKYEVLWSGEDTWILPIRNPHDNTLWGWQEKSAKERAFKNRPLGVTKSRTLFGAHELTPEQAILVESPLDAVRVSSVGAIGGVAAFGAQVSESQIKLLRYSDVVIVALDNPKVDAAGKKGCEAFLQGARKLGITAKFFNYGETGIKDVGDMNNDQILWGIENAIDMIYGEKAYL
jgi:5S rRNA maturation endonuclease (ribonuclease M5)